MTVQCLEQINEKINIPSSKCRVRKIAIFLPEKNYGGLLKRAKNIAKMIFLGSRYHEDDVEVVFSCCQDAYQISDAFSDLLKLGISVRETSWKKISKKEIQVIEKIRPIHKEILFEEYVYPTDGMNNFFDCDFWLLISDHTYLPLAPIFPYGVFVYNYTQRYLPELFIRSYENSNFATVRKADFVFAANPHTLNDAIQFAGINANKISLAPMEFDKPKKPSSPISLHDKEYILWVTNASPHKNHPRVFRALEHYYKDYEGKLDVLVLGIFIDLFKDSSSANPSSYISEIAQKIEKSQILKEKCHILGEVTDTEYSNYLSHASFLLYPSLLHSGAFSVIESAFLRIPCLSSDSPSMRFIDNLFKLNLLFFDPYDAVEMAKKLKHMENDFGTRKDFLPDQNFLEKYTVDKLAPEFWILVKKNLSTMNI